MLGAWDLYLFRAHPTTSQGPLLCNPLCTGVLGTCLPLIGVVGREESLKHTDPPVSCPCAQPVMSKASSSPRAPWLSLWALSTPTTSARGRGVPQGASHPSSQKPVLPKARPSSLCPPPRLWVCASPAQRSPSKGPGPAL